MVAGPGSVFVGLLPESFQVVPGFGESRSFPFPTNLYVHGVPQAIGTRPDILQEKGTGPINAPAQEA
jgi:hypothetical protein